MSKNKLDIGENMNSTNNGLIRKKKVKFAQVSCVALKDKNLSLRAKGLYAIIQNYVTLEDFTIYKSYLISVSGDGKSSFDRAWDELKEHGYLVQYQMQDAAGKIYYEYDLLDEPRELSEEEKAAYAQKEANRKARNQRKVAARKQKSEPQVVVPPTDKTIGGTTMHGTSIRGSSTYINNTDINNTDINNTDDDDNKTEKENHQSSSTISVIENDFDQEDLIDFFETFKTIWTDVTNRPLVIGEKEKRGLIRLMCTHGSDQVIEATNRICESDYLQRELTIHYFITKFENIANGQYKNREHYAAPNFQMDSRQDDYSDIDEKERAYIDSKLAGKC